MSNSNSIPLPPRVKDLTGKVFGRLTATEYAGRSKSGDPLWHVQCECGSQASAIGYNLTSGNTQSCGCLQRERSAQRPSAHEWVGTPEYNCWSNMWQRCTNPKSIGYHLYKDRVPPPEWRSFTKFLADVGPKPLPDLSLDRIDNDKPYGPGNVRWATRAAQNRNRSDNVWVTTPDGQRLCLKDACSLVGLVREGVNYGRSKGQTVEEASKGLLREAA